MTKIKNIQKSITEELIKYSRLIEEEFETSKKEVAQAALKEIKADSPEDTGSYKKGWRIKKTGSAYTIHNKTNYQLTHLLEHGHVLRNGGRSESKPHIAPAEEKAVKEFLKRIEKMVKKP